MNAAVPGSVGREACSWSNRDKYREWCSNPLGRAYRASLERVLARWIAEPEPRRILDAGAGPTPRCLEHLAPGSRLVATDRSLEFAHAAGEQVARRLRGSGAVCASIDALPFASERFDLVLSINCLEFVEDPARAIAELHRVSAPGARAIVAVLNRRGTWEWTRRSQEPVRSWPYYRGRFFTEREIAAALESAGWSVLAIERAVHFPPLPLPSEAWYAWIERLVPDALAGVLLVLAERRED